MDGEKRRKQEEQKRIREAIAQAGALTADSLEWKPYYPNNLIECGQEGWYCVHQQEGGDRAAKYTILFQYYEDGDFLTHPGRGVELYVLCCKTYFGLDGPLAYPAPGKAPGGAPDINDHGRFLHAYPTLEQAKGKVLWMLRKQGYILSYLLDGEEDGVE